MDVPEIANEMLANGGNPKAFCVLMAPESTNTANCSSTTTIVDKLASGAIAGIVGTTT